MIKNVSIETQGELIRSKNFELGEKKKRGRKSKNGMETFTPIEKSIKKQNPCETKIVTLNKVELAPNEVQIFTKYINKLIEIVSRNGSMIENDICTDLIRWRDIVLKNGYLTTPTKTANYFSILVNKVNTTKSSYGFFNSKVSNDKAEELKILADNIRNDIHNCSGVSTKTTPRIPLTEYETKLFKCYAAKLIMAIYDDKDCGSNLKFNLLNSLTAWREAFIKNGYRKGKRYEIVTTVLEKITTIKLYYKDAEDVIPESISPIEERLIKDPIYLEYIEQHPNYNYNIL